MRNYSNLRATTTEGKSYSFDIRAVPTVIDTDRFILMHKVGSPILLTDTICLGADINGVYEGTVLRDANGIEYTVSYKRGFAAMDSNRVAHKLHDITPFTVLGENGNISTSCRARVLYKYEDIYFQITDILGVVEDKIIIKNNRVAINFDLVKQFAGLKVDNKRVFLGDEIDDGIVVMHLGRICLYANNKYIDLADKEEIPICM